MSDRWTIFKDGKQLGPYSAAEVREQLREGELDPFDLVAREGSSLRRELVEIDELFATAPSPGVFDDNAKTETLGKNPGRPGVVDRLVAGEAQLPGGFTPPDEVVKGKLHLASAEAVNGTQTRGAATPAAEPQGGGRKRKKDPKHYHLKDAKGRILGPLSATDVQSLFYKGVIDKTVVVTRQGSTAKVTVERFVAVFSKSKGGGGVPRQQAQQTQLRRMATAQKQRFSRVQGQQALTLGLVVVAVALLSLAAWLAYKKGATIWLQEQFTASSDVVAPKPHLPPENRRPVAAVNGAGSLPRPAPANSFSPPAAKPRPVVPPAAPRGDDRAERRAKAAARERAKAKAQAARGKVRPAVIVKAPKGPKPTAAKVAFVPAAKQPPAPVPSPAPKPVAKTPAPKPGPSVATLVDGQQVTRFGPLRYDPAAVAKCASACVLPFSGGGGTVTGRFFKDGFGDALAAHRGTAYISGIVRKSGDSATILVQDVQ